MRSKFHLIFSEIYCLHPLLQHQDTMAKMCAQLNRMVPYPYKKRNVLISSVCTIYSCNYEARLQILLQLTYRVLLLQR